MSFLQWAQEHAVPVDLSANPVREIEKLNCLDDLIRNKSVVYLGEPDHFIREKYGFQSLFIKYLTRRGWNTIGKEIGRSDGQKIDRYIKTGDERYLDLVALYGFDGATRTDRLDFPKGRLAPRRAMDTQPFHAMELGFCRELRTIAYAGRNNIRFVGYDIDVCPGGAYEDIAAILALAQSASCIDNIRQLLERVPYETAQGEVARLNQAMRYLSSHGAEFQRALGNAAFVELKANLMCLTASFQFVVNAFPEPTIDQLWCAFEKREQCMCSLLNDVLDKMTKNDKLILLGHNMHLSKKSHLLDSFDLCGSEVPMWPSVGSLVAQRLPQQVLSVWMLYNEGNHCGPFVGIDDNYVRRQQHSIEDLLAQIGESFILPIATAPGHVKQYLSQYQVFGCNGEPAHGMVSEQADIIAFVSQVSAL
ncbi:MAG: erythromycin esterase family protein [Candidatus Obscuribacterales bacterium]|nr:erythromycin esterase family protein [Candidatus Obscuribacterales bacterium]